MAFLLHNASLSEQSSSRNHRDDALDASPRGLRLARPECCTDQENACLPPGARRGNTVCLISPQLQEPGQGYCDLHASDIVHGEATVGRPGRKSKPTWRVKDNLEQERVVAPGDTFVSPTASTRHAVTLLFTILTVLAPLPRDSDMLCLLSCVAMYLHVVQR